MSFFWSAPAERSGDGALDESAPRRSLSKLELSRQSGVRWPPHSKTWASVRRKYTPNSALSLVELLVVIAIIAVLAALLLPVLGKSKAQAETLTCSNNQKQLFLAWQLYADENNDLLVNNHGVPETLARRQTWANNVLDWEPSDDNTNVLLLTEAKLGPFANRSARIYKCPGDREPGPNGPRTRSMSMNAMVGNPGELTNQFNPVYIQFYRKAAISRPSGIFVFLDEQADTINDGFFVNRLEDGAWGNLPGPYHNAGANFAFADGHLEHHHWLVPATARAVQRTRIDKFPAAPPTDFDWLKERTSVKRVD